MNEGGKAADKVDIQLFCRLVERFSPFGVIAFIGTFGDHGNRRYGNPLVDNRHAEFRFYVFARAGKFTAVFHQFIVHARAAFFSGRAAAIAQRYSHRDCAHVELVAHKHVDRFLNFRS